MFLISTRSRLHAFRRQYSNLLTNNLQLPTNNPGYFRAAKLTAKLLWADLFANFQITAPLLSTRFQFQQLAVSFVFSIR